MMFSRSAIVWGIRSARAPTKWHALPAVLEHANGNVETIECGQILGRKVVLELAGEMLRVALPDLENDQGADVTEHRSPDRLLELIFVLVEEGEREAVLASFREDRCEALGRKVLKLVRV